MLTEGKKRNDIWGGSKGQPSTQGLAQRGKSCRKKRGHLTGIKTAKRILGKIREGVGRRCEKKGIPNEPKSNKENVRD